MTTKEARKAYESAKRKWDKLQAKVKAAEVLSESARAEMLAANSAYRKVLEADAEGSE